MKTSGCTDASHKRRVLEDLYILDMILADVLITNTISLMFKLCFPNSVCPQYTGCNLQVVIWSVSETVLLLYEYLLSH